MKLSFDKRIYEVCEERAKYSKKEITEIYSSINLTDAKLSFMDGQSPKDYAHTIN